MGRQSLAAPSGRGDCGEERGGHQGPARARGRPRWVELATGWPCRPADRQVRPAGPEEGPAPVWHPGQRGPHQRLEHHPDRREAWRGGGGRGRGQGAWRDPDGVPFEQSPILPLLQFRCCGVSNYTDWFEVYNATRVPDSCCLEFSESCGLHAPGTWWKAVSLPSGWPQPGAVGAEGRPCRPRDADSSPSHVMRP